MQKNIGLYVLLALVAALVVPNIRSLYEGVFFYLRDTASYNPKPTQPIQRNGRYASIYDLVQLRNAERQAYIEKRLRTIDVSITRIPIPDSQLQSILVRFDPSGPHTLFSAHFDKLFDDPNYQGASDNTAAVSVLLASIEELARQDYHGSAAFLFTGEEEKGLRGSAAFIEYAHTNSIAIRENVNFDNLGRGKLGIRPSAPVPGFVFTIPFWGDWAFDGREFRPSPPYPPVPARLVQALVRTQPETTVYERFTAQSDSNVFQDNGVDTVAISGDDMRFLELTWHTYADRVDLLDERDLNLAYDMIVRYVQNR